MGLSLVCAEDSGNQKKNGYKSMQFMDECVDVLRSFGRVGMFTLESASIDCEKCEDYLALAKEAFSSSMQLWSRIGLSHLTKFKQGLELDDVVDDLWDFCVDRVRVLRLLTEGASNVSDEYIAIVSSLHELKMLAPYKPSYASSLLDIMKRVSDGYSDAAHHEQQVIFAEEALGVGDSLENDADDNFPELMLLLMNKLYIDNKQFDKAKWLLKLLFRQDSFEESISGARAYAQGLSFSEKGLEIYGELADNYGGAEFAINVDIACNLAFVEDKRYDAMDELKRIGCALLEREQNGQTTDSRHILRVQQTICDALQHAQNSNHHKECLRWADAGLAGASTTHDKAMYMRAMSRSYLQLGRGSEAVEWAEKAVSTEPSKKSLFAMFQVAIEANPGASEEKLTRIMDQLKTRDDFEMEDLLAMGKLASKFGASRQNIVMKILDELCHTLAQTDDCLKKIPVAIVLQNAAQLAFNRFTKQQIRSSDNSTRSYGDKFLTYANAFLMKASKLDTDIHIENFGPPSIFEWFYQMSFDIAKGTEDSRYFIMAANIAERSDELYGEESPLKQRCQQCLLQMLVKEDTVDTDKLCYVLRRLVTHADSKAKALEWFEQLLQFIDSLDFTFSEIDLEWFIAKAWNIVSSPIASCFCWIY
ncbi:hypothetical protein PHMEG_0001352 [Phytophthora megakarya]|uniref:Uncharacterized protein n=1 Tax=Phytophthora megakarya TaxID=4795 RepID=A0A225X1D6_9STRA|nr:hypothetical protein PHMEG_0001352 [Phytophthora megakarya]